MLLEKTRNLTCFVRLGLQVFGVYVVFAYGNKCGQSEYPSASEECCPMCNIGTVVYRDCKGDASTTCIPCARGTYMDTPNGLHMCFPCKICDHFQGLSTAQGCSTIKNTVCGVLDGYYCKESRDGECTFALKHTKCQPGQETKAPGTKTSDTVCEACRPGYYSPLGVNCTKWTDCSVKHEVTDEEGSSVKDVTCKPRRRGRYGLYSASVPLLGLLIFFFKLKLAPEETKRQVTEDKRAEADLNKSEEETSTNVPVETREDEMTTVT